MEKEDTSCVEYKTLMIVLIYYKCPMIMIKNIKDNSDN